jgi:hypothetical protein
VGGNPELVRLIVHLVNFPNFIGSPIEVGERSWVSGRALLSARGWRFTIDACPSIGHLVESLNSTGGYAITHVGVLEREDGEAFRPSEANDQLDSLGSFLSFAAGAWAVPQLHVGIAPDGREVFRQYGVRQVGSWGGRFRWFNHDDVASLERAFAGFDRLWAKDVWREPLKKLVYL